MRFAILAFTTLFALPPGAIQITHVDWKPGPPSMPKGSKMAVLEGDSKAAGIFTMRLMIPAGSRVQPHWHPRPERVTILSGEVRVGFGDEFTTNGMTKFGAGDFYINPPESHHYVSFPRDSVIQITGEGPWEIHFLKP